MNDNIFSFLYIYLFTTLEQLRYFIEIIINLFPIIILRLIHIYQKFYEFSLNEFTYFPTFGSTFPRNLRW